jgi:fructose-bisphosphate aldolase/2-amino-3,7-dideoxy-D-threo-hept-6-ulosonate synthase
MLGGATGISIGRNAFQHPKPASFIKAAALIVHEGRSAEEANEFLKGRGS